MQNQINRRGFLSCLGAYGMGAMCFSHFTVPWKNSPVSVLVLGGTNFLGPAIVQSLVQRGHHVTLFNRGKTNPHLFPKLKKIRGDREDNKSGYKKLRDDSASWDVVIDVWPDNPNLVEDAAHILQDRTKYYIFVSSIAVYRNYKEIGLNERHPLRAAREYVKDHYNENKVLCEKVVEKYFPGNFTIVRPGAIVGDRDPGPFGLDLLKRIANCREIMAPDSNDPVQLIDAADIGNFVTRCCEKRLVGHFNLVGPEKQLGYRDMLIQIKSTLESEVNIRWMQPDFLINKMNLEPFLDIPFWIPIKTDPEPGFYQISNEKAMQAGLNFTPLPETIKTSFESFQEKRYIPEVESESIFGISEKRENEIIEFWKRNR